MPDRPVETEAQFQQRVLEAAALYGWRANHTRKATVRAGRIATPTSCPGWPDLVLWHPGRGGLIFRELKTDRGVASTTQLEVLSSLANSGADVAVWRPRDWDLIVETLRDGPPAGIDWRHIAVQFARYGGSYHGLTEAERAALIAEVDGENEAEWGTSYERTADAATGLENR